MRIITNTSKCESWLGGLQPYKDYFRSLYGGVQYKNDKRPIKGYSLADSIAISDKCPYGFSQPTYRPDLYGFGPISKYIVDKSNNTQYERVMVWQPTGLYKNNHNLNFAFKFTSHWLEGDTNLFSHSYGHKMGDAVDSLKKIATPNRQLGFWWGRAGHLMVDWDTSHYERLNPYNPAHVNIGYKELDLAVKAGATLIGLDNYYTQIPGWDAYVWMKMMRARAPKVQFLTEKWSFDVLLTVAGMLGKDDNIKTPFYLADFLVLGNEKQALMWNSFNKEDRDARRAQLNGWGYSVTSFDRDTLAIKGGALAREGWYDNNPYPDLGPDMCNNPAGIILNGKCKGSASYLWSTGAKTYAITVKSPGIYSVTTTISGGCTAIDTIKITNCVASKQDGKDELGNEAPKVLNDLVNIYPNPATESLTIANISEENIESIKLYDVLGNLVAEVHKELIAQTAATISITDYVAGIYYVLISTEHNSCSKKLIIVR